MFNYDKNVSQFWNLNSFKQNIIIQKHTHCVNDDHYIATLRQLKHSKQIFFIDYRNINVNVTKKTKFQLYNFFVKRLFFERFNHFFNSIHQNILLKFEFFNDIVVFLIDVMTINETSFVMLLTNATKKTKKKFAITKNLFLFRFELIFRQLFHDNFLWFVRKIVFHEFVQFRNENVKFFDQKSSIQYIKFRLNRMLTCDFDDARYSFKKIESICFDDAITIKNNNFDNIFHFELMNFDVFVELFDLFLFNNNKMITQMREYWINFDFEIVWMHEFLIRIVFIIIVIVIEHRIITTFDDICARFKIKKSKFNDRKIKIFWKNQEKLNRKFYRICYSCVKFE